MPTRFDFSDPRYLIVYAPEEADHNHLEDMTLWLKTWVEHMDSRPGRFGVVLVNHPHEHEEHEHERNEAEENALTALATAFRRDHRARINRRTTGYASVYDVAMSETEWATADQHTAQFADYAFGIRGGLFRDLGRAKQWLDSIATLEPLPLDAVGLGEATTTDTAIFYGSTTGLTELIAEKIQLAWQGAHEETLPIINVGDQAELVKLFSFDRLLVGIPTWNVGKLQDDWEFVFPYLDHVDLTGKRIALFGIGDQFGYPENFQDAMGILGRKLRERGAHLVGSTSVEGYEHTHSLGEEDGRFMGLAIDDENQPELTDERIARWIAQITREFEIPAAEPVVGFA